MRVLPVPLSALPTTARTWPAVPRSDRPAGIVSHVSTTSLVRCSVSIAVSSTMPMPATALLPNSHVPPELFAFCTRFSFCHARDNMYCAVYSVPDAYIAHLPDERCVTYRGSLHILKTWRHPPAGGPPRAPQRTSRIRNAFACNDCHERLFNCRKDCFCGTLPADAPAPPRALSRLVAHHCGGIPSQHVVVLPLPMLEADAGGAPYPRYH